MPRRALLSRLKNQGKYNPAHAALHDGTGRHPGRAGPLRRSREAWRGVARDQRTRRRRRRPSATRSMLSQLGGILNLQRKGRKRSTVYAQLDKAIANWEPQRRQVVRTQRRRGSMSLYASGQIEAGIAAAEQLVKQPGRARRREPFRYRRGARHAGGRPDAGGARRRCDPRVQGGDPDPDGGVARERRRRRHHRRSRRAASGCRASSRPISSCWRASRTRPAMSAPKPSRWPTRSAAARCSRRWRRPARARPPRIRRWPTWSARSRTSASRSMPSSARSTTCCRCRRASATRRASRRSTPRSTSCAPNALKARAGHRRALPGLCRSGRSQSRRSVEQIKATLADGEALLSFYFGAIGSFVWAVPKDGAGRVCRDQGHQRRHREQGPQAARGAGAAGGDDLRHSAVRSRARARALLAAAQAGRGGWKPAKNLIVVTNGALGLLPLSLLPTAPAEVRRRRRAAVRGYRERAVAGAHPCGDDGAVGRGAAHAAATAARQAATAAKLIAFGDPYFSKEQAAEADKADKRAGSPMPPATRRAACR